MSHEIELGDIPDRINCKQDVDDVFEVFQKAANEYVAKRMSPDVASTMRDRYGDVVYDRRVFVQWREKERYEQFIPKLRDLLTAAGIEAAAEDPNWNPNQQTLAVVQHFLTQKAELEKIFGGANEYDDVWSRCKSLARLNDQLKEFSKSEMQKLVKIVDTIAYRAPSGT